MLSLAAKERQKGIDVALRLEMLQELRSIN
jgi:hypothetical protein